MSKNRRASATGTIRRTERLDLMAAELNIRTQATGRSALLAALAATAASVSCAWGDEAWPKNKGPQRLPATTRPVGFRIPASGDAGIKPSLVIREPREEASAWPASAASVSPSATSPPVSAIQAAAQRERDSRLPPSWRAVEDQKPVLPGYSVDSLRGSATVLIEEASLKLASRAYLTAGAKATEALRWLAQAADAQSTHGQHLAGPASGDLAIALMAIREAEDFVGKYGTVDSEAIARMVRSHETDFLKPYSTVQLNGLAAADVYLNGARQRLTALAAADPMAAEAIRILAQSYRLRDGGTAVGLATSVHLMRAAAGGAPEDRQIAVDLAHTLKAAGLHEESQWAAARVARLSPGGGASELSMLAADELQHAEYRSGGLPTDVFAGHGRPQLELVQISPEQFAAISSAAAGPPGVPQPAVSAAQAQRPGAAEAPAVEVASNASAADQRGTSNRFSRALDPIRRLWQ